MYLGVDETMSNRLNICLDWLSFTVLEVAPDKVLRMLGYSAAEFQSLPKGANGYKSRLRHSSLPISVLYDGLDGMGVHVDISGSAVPDVLNHYRDLHTSSPSPFGYKAYDTKDFDIPVLRDMLLEIRRLGHITRLDLAVDDIGAQYFTLSDLSSQLRNGHVISKFRTFREMTGGEISTGAPTGHTLYFGSSKSEIMLRVYDKQLEQNEKLKQTEHPPILYPWVRWEFQLRKERATQAVDQLLSGCSLSELTVGILANYLRLVQDDNSRRDRCSLNPVWELFLNGIEKLSLYCAPAARTLDDIKDWLKRQVSSSLAAVVMSEGGCTSFLEYLLEIGRVRLSSHQRDLVYREMGAA